MLRTGATQLPRVFGIQTSKNQRTFARLAFFVHVLQVCLAVADVRNSQNRPRGEPPFSPQEHARRLKIGIVQVVGTYHNKIVQLPDQGFWVTRSGFSLFQPQDHPPAQNFRHFISFHCIPKLFHIDHFAEKSLLGPELGSGWFPRKIGFPVPAQGVIFQLHGQYEKVSG